MDYNHINMKPIIISIDGNIGSGKSSIVRYLKKNFTNFLEHKHNNIKVCFLDEPVDVWESIIDNNDNKNIIEKFYENNNKYAFAFQMMAYISRLKLLKNAIKENYDIIITERSILTDKNIFTKMLYNSGDINEIENQIYNKWFDEFSECIQNIKYIYIKTNPDICFTRVVERNRLGENISLSYLKNSHYFHEIWLNSVDLIEQGKVLVIDGNEKTNTSLFIKNNFYDKIIDNIYNFIKIEI